MTSIQEDSFPQPQSLFSSRPSPQEEFERIQSYYPQLSSTGCTPSFCQSGRMVHTNEVRVGGNFDAEAVEAEAVDFLHQLRRDGIIESDTALRERVANVLDEIRLNSVMLPGTDEREPAIIAGNWHQTTQELEHGVRLSWKHARKCIMRSEYTCLRLHDLRHIKTSKEMGRALLEGMHGAFNGGDIQPSVFAFSPRKPNRPGPMVWNQQLLAFAGYRQPDGSVLGDPMNLALTNSITSLGWEPPAMRTRWDLLPLVTMAEGDEPYITPIPEELFPPVPIRHPSAKYSLAFDKLGLRWVPMPALSRLGFVIGGVQYTAAPFIGWFMDAEIGVRDLADSFRYDILPSVVSALKLLQPDQELDELSQCERLALLSHAQVELNFAVNWSYAQAGVRMSDSLTASAMYTNFDDQHLVKYGFRLPADPYWISPPQGSIIPVWHRGGVPNYQPKPMICRLKQSPIKVWERLKDEKDGKALDGDGALYFPDKAEHKSEERLRTIVGHTSKHQSIAPIAVLNDLEVGALASGDLILIIASCAGRGNIPANGVSMLNNFKSPSTFKRSKVSFSIFGNGNSSYGINFNGSAVKLQTTMEEAGFTLEMPLFQADTLKEDPPWRQFDSWLALLEARYGDTTVTPSNGSAELVNDEASELLLPQLSTAELISVHNPSAGEMKLVTLDVGKLEYSHMSHVDVFVPLNKDKIDDLLWIFRLTGTEICTFEEGEVSTRQLFSLVDTNKPFRSIKWAKRLWSGLSSEEWAKLQQSPLRDSIKYLPIGWQAKVKRTNLADFMLALPMRQPRTFSTASSQMFWGKQDMRNVLELMLQTHAGGLFTDKFLSNARKGDLLYIRIRRGPGKHLIHDKAPLIAFTTGSGIAPLRGLLQARSVLATERLAGSKVPDPETAKIAVGNPVSLFLGFRSGDAEVISESVREVRELGLVDILVLTPSNPSKERAQDRIFTGEIGRQIRRKIRDQEANVFVCASKEAADDFARNLEATVGVTSIRDVMGERWVEEIYVCTT